MNRPLRHDALLVWRETSAALASWGDRVLVLIGLAMVLAGARAAADGATSPVLEAIAGLIGASAGLGLGRIVARRLVFHATDYLYSADILSGAGAARYRGGIIAAVEVGVIAVAAIGGPRAVMAALGGYALGLAVALAWEGWPVGRFGASTGKDGRWRIAAGIAIALLLASVRWWWPTAPAWSAAPPICVAVALMVPDDAAAARFDAIVGRAVRGTLGGLGPAVLWLVGLTLVTALAQGLFAAMIGAAAGLVPIWLGTLRLLAWRMCGRRSGNVIVLAIVAVSGVAGALAIVLAPVALAAATVWLWRRSHAARWLIA